MLIFFFIQETSDNNTVNTSKDGSKSVTGNLDDNR